MAFYRYKFKYLIEKEEEEEMNKFKHLILREREKKTTTHKRGKQMIASKNNKMYSFLRGQILSLCPERNRGKKAESRQANDGK